MMTTKRLRQLGLASFAVLFLAACGQKGPLRMPSEDPEKTSVNQGVSNERLSERSEQ